MLFRSVLCELSRPWGPGPCGRLNMVWDMVTLETINLPFAVTDDLKLELLVKPSNTHPPWSTKKLIYLFGVLQNLISMITVSFVIQGSTPREIVK